MSTKYLIVVFISMVVAACDGGSDGAPPVNTAPTISQVPAQSTGANQASQPISFSVSDEQVGNLGLTAMSDNQLVVPDGGLILGGSDTSRTITISPVSDTLGDAFVTIIVTDTDGLSASTSFLLTITPQQKSLQQFTRTSFADSADGEPELINAVEFAQDADDDDFADLLAQ